MNRLSKKDDVPKSGITMSRSIVMFSPQGRFWFGISTQVPALEHNNEIIAESLDLIKYLDTHFEGPSLLPDVRFRWISSKQLVTLHI